MARSVTVVSQDKVLKIAAKVGLNLKVGKGETKIFGASIKQSIAIPNTKGGATRIYCVGFAPSEGTVPHPKPPASTVTVMFDHGLEEPLLLRAIFKAASSLAVKAEAPATPATESTEAPASSPAISEGTEEQPVEESTEQVEAQEEQPEALEQQVA